MIVLQLQLAKIVRGKVECLPVMTSSGSNHLFTYFYDLILLRSLNYIHNSNFLLGVKTTYLAPQLPATVAPNDGQMSANVRACLSMKCSGPKCGQVGRSTREISRNE